MSQQTDNLKSIFEQTFAAEQIPFDPAGWDKMNAMLNARHRKRLFGVGLMSIGLFVLGSFAMLAGFSESNVYIPRTSGYSLASEWSTPDQVNGTTAHETISKKSANESPMGLVPKESSPNEMELPSTPESSPTVPSEKPMATVERSGAVDQTSDRTITIEDDEESPSVVSVNHPTIQKPVVETRTPDFIDGDGVLDLMPLLDATLTASEITSEISYENNEPEPVRIEYRPAFYITAGLNKTLGKGFASYNGFGQRFGIGASHQILEHIILNAELAGTRMVFSDTANISSTTYGMSRIENEYIIHTTELWKMELPLVAHYRMKRYYLGAGLNPSYMLGLKNETIHQIEANESLVFSETSDKGFYRWDRYRAIGLDIIGDAQIQVSDDLFVGLRGNFGFIDVLATSQRQLRLSRIDAYIKFNIK